MRMSKSSTRSRLGTAAHCLTAAALLVFCAAVGGVAQHRLKALPGYAQYHRMAGEIPHAVKSGALSARWTDDSRAAEFTKDGKRYRFDVATQSISEAVEAPSRERGTESGAPSGPDEDPPERGRQYTMALSPDGTLKAFYKDRNVYLSALDGSHEVTVTSDGSTATRVKYGTASWVYGEELEQKTAMWWSPDGRYLAYYRFDEQAVPDFYLPLDQLKLHTSVDIEAYPKAGKANPIVDLFVFDVSARRSIRIDVRNGRSFDDSVVGHYVYRIQWSPDGRELLFLRTNRRQNIMELAAADPSSCGFRLFVV